MLVGLRIALGIAWLVVVAAEMIAVDSGLGYLVIDARNAGKRYDLVVAAMHPDRSDRPRARISGSGAPRRSSPFDGGSGMHLSRRAMLGACWLDWHWSPGSTPI